MNDCVKTVGKVGAQYIAPARQGKNVVNYCALCYATIVAADAMYYVPAIIRNADGS